MSNASTMYPDNSSRAVRRDKDYILEQFDALSRPLAALLSLTPPRLREALAGIVRKYYLKRQEVTCQLTTLSEFLSKHSIRRIDLLKLDAEQSERQILDGLAEQDWHKVRQMVVEVHEGEEATEAMAASLRGRGFVTAVEPNPTFRSLSLVFGTRPHLAGASE